MLKTQTLSLPPVKQLLMSCVMLKTQSLSLPPAKQLLMSCVMLKTQSLSLPPVKQLLMSCVMLKTQTLLSTGEAAPTGSVPHSELIVSTVRHVTGTGSGLLGGIPRVVVQMSALTLKGPL